MVKSTAKEIQRLEKAIQAIRKQRMALKGKQGILQLELEALLEKDKAQSKIAGLSRSEKAALFEELKDGG